MAVILKNEPRQPRPSQAATSGDFGGAKRSQTKALRRAEEGAGLFY